MEPCPCGYNKEYNDCCKPLISGLKNAETAEQLLRSRYTAYLKEEIPYIIKTTLPEKRSELKEDEILSWARNTKWIRIEIDASNRGSSSEKESIVEFTAFYKDKELICRHREKSFFEKVDNIWYYKDSEFPQQQQIKRSDPKIQRNEICPCGKGKKYKKCCGATNDRNSGK